MARRKNRKPLLKDNHLILNDISPITDSQIAFFDRYDTDKSQVLLGYPGSGKTFLALYKAFEEISDPKSEYHRIVIVRSAVPTRDMGFLPGSEKEKAEVYELPYKSICNELFGRGDAYELLKKQGVLEFMTTSFIRGITLDRTIVIVDEFQSLNGHELESIVTRVGNYSKILFCGDFGQTDLTKLSEKEGAKQFLGVLQNMPDFFDVTGFGIEDIVRSGMVKQFIIQRVKQYPEGL